MEEELTAEQKAFNEKVLSLTLPNRSRANPDPKTFAPTVGGVSVSAREKQIAEHVKSTRKNLHRKTGASKDGNMRHVASVPVEVFEHVRRNEGSEAADDVKHVLKTAKDLGIDCETGGKK